MHRSWLASMRKINGDEFWRGSGERERWHVARGATDLVKEAFTCLPCTFHGRVVWDDASGDW